MPDAKFFKEASTSLQLFPKLETMPMPVTTTRFMIYPPFDLKAALHFQINESPKFKAFFDKKPLSVTKRYVILMN